jgi:hypothetical protein
MYMRYKYTECSQILNSLGLNEFDFGTTQIHRPHWLGVALGGMSQQANTPVPSLPDSTFVGIHFKTLAG